MRRNRKPYKARLLAVGALALSTLPGTPLQAQWWDAPAAAAAKVSEQTGGKISFTFEERTRLEDKTGVNFGKSPDLSYGLQRTRFGMSYKPFEWLKVSGMVQDSRSPGYENAPSTVRDPADLHEAYVELFPDQKTGFGLSAGRRMITYGEGRLIGVPEWSNLSRTYDHARAYYRFRRASIEMLFASPVKTRIGEFNQPVLGDHIWGTYNVFPNLWQENSLDAYALRREQNRPGGFTGGSTQAGTDRLITNTYGFRLTGPLTFGMKYSVEGALQSGQVGSASQYGAGWFSGVNRPVTLWGKSLNLSGEYKYASGNKDPNDKAHIGTFDQLYAANHDRFGHQDLFGWRNIHHLRSLETYGLTKAFALNFMYTNLWLASVRDGLYNGSGKMIAQSVTGTAGRHVGQETDLFATYKFHHFLFGAGGGYFFKGEFIQNTTPGAGPTYMYVFQTYSF